jgi:hypothetical protein
MSPIYVPGKVVLKKDGVAATDTNIREVSLLLHGNQSGGQFVDSSLSPKTITTVGNAAPGSPGGGTPVYPSGNSAFGSAIAFDGTGDFLGLGTGVAAFNFGAEDFTVEAWVYRLNTNNSYVALGQCDLTTISGSSWAFALSSSITTDVYSGSTAYTVASPNPSANIWSHVAMTRSGGTLRTFLNGNVVGTNSSLGSNVANNGSTAFQASVGGQANSFNSLNGYIDDLRITKGVARYTANFTPPTLPFPDF